MAEFQNILAFDTALSGCGVGVFSGASRYARTEAMSSGQAERLMPIIADVMGQAGIKFEDLDAVVTTTGPGAFTGLRIGMSAAKALGLSLGIPVFGITTLQALATQYAREKNPADSLAVIIETKREDFYFEVFSREAQGVSEAAAVPGADILRTIKGKKVVILGDGAARFKSMDGAADLNFAEGFQVPDMGFIAANFYEKSSGDVYIQSPEPVYLRGADVTTSTKPARPPIAV